MLAQSKECRTDFNKNGKKDVFEDSKQPVEKRIANLLSQMTLDEKTGQLATLYGYGRVLNDSLAKTDWKTKVWKDGIAFKILIGSSSEDIRAKKDFFIIQ